RAGVVAAEPRARELLVALEEVGDVLARLLERLLFGGRRVDRDAQAHVAVARMARLTPRGAVRLEVHAKLGQIHVTEADEEPQPRAPDPRERLPGVGGHAQRRVRLLDRRRRDHGVAHREELALVVEALALPCLAHDGQRLLEARLALTVRDAESVVGARAAATADTQVEAPLAQVIDRRDLF